MASAGYVNERPILGCRVRALNDRLWVVGGNRAGRPPLTKPDDARSRIRIEKELSSSTFPIGKVKIQGLASASRANGQSKDPITSRPVALGSPPFIRSTKSVERTK
jgi:hypothetical protein